MADVLTLDEAMKAAGNQDSSSQVMTLDQAMKAAQPQQSAPFWSWSRIKGAMSNVPPVYEGSLPPEATASAGKIMKNAAIGAGEAVSGVGELVPQLAPGPNYAVRASQELKQMEDPGWQYQAAKGAGYVAPLLLGGGEGAAARLVPKAAEEAGFLTKMGLGAARSALGGAAAGGKMGLTKPTGEEDTGKRLEEKAESAGKDALAGAAVGAAGGSLGALGSQGKKLYQAATGQAATKAAEDIRSGLSGEAKGVVGEKTSGELRRAAGEQQVQADQAKAAADRLAGALRTDPLMDSAKIGGQIRAEAQKMLDEGVETRSRDAGIGEVLRKYGDKPIVNVKNIVSNLSRQLKKQPHTGEVAGDIRHVKSLFRPEGEGEENIQATIDDINNHLAMADPNSSVYGDLKRMLDSVRQNDGKISLPVADNVRKQLGKIIAMKTISVGNTSRAVDKATLQFVNRTYMDLVKATRAAAPDYGAAIARFRELSRPIDWLERKGVMAKWLKTDEFSGEYRTAEGGIIQQLALQARKGDNTLKRLMLQDPRLKDSARAYFANQLFGAKDSVTDAAFAKFVNDNSRALKQLGLEDEFSTAAKAQETASRLADSAKTAESDVDETAKYEKMVVDLKGENLKPEGVVRTGQGFIDKLLNDEKITIDQYDAYKSAIKEAGDMYDEAKKVKEVVSRIVGAAVLAGLGYGAYRELRAHLDLF